MICVDSSVAAKWWFVEEHSVRARSLLREALTTAELVLAPTLLPCEIANVLRQRMRRGEMDRGEALEVLSGFLALPIEIQAPQGLHERALEIADEYGLPAVYDGHYVALAEMVGATLWTADRRLLRAVGGKMPFLRDIAEYRQA